ncbi:beta-galactosidase [Microlunatus sp. GCM10028923]|uniref:beta-galactosidase n=1 Tax=Microlunatus sp. GCM10028923 TaxID=3273400 RepID=UPI00361DC0BD
MNAPRDFTSHAADLTAPRTFRWLADGLGYGGDYNPEQWPEEVWAEDLRLMTEAGVSVVSVGIFAWSLLEVDQDSFEFGWLDRVLDGLAGAGIGAALATPTAGPPPWLLRRYPEVLTVDANGRRNGPGARLGWCPSSVIFRERATKIVEALANRYGDHPALRLWHVSNEIGNENGRCYCDACAAAFGRWLEQRYGDIEALNQAWGTAFWGHHYLQFADVPLPRAISGNHNPALVLDYHRFSSDVLLDHFRLERGLLRRLTPDVPITTNFMVKPTLAPVDYAAWADEVDLVANDHYTTADDPHRHWSLALSADQARGVSRGRPWLLMEHSTSAVNWQPRNRAKAPGELIRDSLSHVARGADGAMFFQWRQSTAGAEQYHSAMLPHAGTDTKVWREVVRLGDHLRSLAELRGSTVERPGIAMIMDYASQWALRSWGKPTVELDPLELPSVLHRACTRRHRVVDVVRPDASLDGYRLIILPMLHLAYDGLAERLAAAVESGAEVLITYFSGIADQTGRVITGGYPGAYRDLLGIRGEEFFPLLEGETQPLDNGWTGGSWTELLQTTTATGVAHYVDGPLAGTPAYTRLELGAGAANYLATRPTDDDLQALVDDLLGRADVPVVAAADDGLQVVRRRQGEQGYLFGINHDDAPRNLTATGTDLLTGQRHAGQVTVEPGGVVVIKEQG